MPEESGQSRGRGQATGPSCLVEGQSQHSHHRATVTAKQLSDHRTLRLKPTAWYMSLTVPCLWDKELQPGEAGGTEAAPPWEEPQRGRQEGAGGGAGAGGCSPDWTPGPTCCPSPGPTSLSFASHRITDAGLRLVSWRALSSTVLTPHQAPGTAVGRGCPTCQRFLVETSSPEEAR